MILDITGFLHEPAWCLEYIGLMAWVSIIRPTDSKRASIAHNIVLYLNLETRLMVRAISHFFLANDQENVLIILENDEKK